MGDLKLTKRISLFVGKSFVVIIVSALILGVIFGSNGDTTIFAFDNSLRGAVLYFIVALSAGFAATFAWIRREISEILPGVAIAVSLVPPLALIGVGLSTFALAVVRFNFFVFFFNFLGVIVGSSLVFSLLKFYKVEKKVEQEEEKVQKEQEEQKEQKEQEKQEK